MDIQFCGAARNVTGSRHLLHVNGKKILFDCGLYQGRRQESLEMNRDFLFDPKEVDLMILSHAHIDHSGNIPNLVAQGFDGPIYTTHATVSLCQIMLRDSAFIQEKDVYYLNKRRKKQNLPPVAPLYTIADAENAMPLFVGLQYDREFEIAPGVKLTFRDAGHILGSSCVELHIVENGRKFRLGFTGDVGRESMPILRDPNKMRHLDALIMETTYGNRLHSEPEEKTDLGNIINRACERGGKIIIPSFAIGRTQQLVYELHKLFDQNRIPNLPIYVDSPLACNATDVFRSHPECFDRETYRLFLSEKDDPFGFGRLEYVREVDDSKALAQLTEPHIIISASGMCEAGRILHHLKNNIEHRRNLILFVGYAAEHTLARKIMDGEKKVRIFHDEYKVRAEIQKIDFFSGHADANELMDYLQFIRPERCKDIFLVHGEADQAQPFQERLFKKGYENVHFPRLGQKFEL